MKQQKPNRDNRKSGQAIIFLLMVLVIGLVVLLFNFELHNVVSTKMRVNNAGDAAALAAARWQGITLNMVGELNLIQAAYLCHNIEYPTNEANIAELKLNADAIANLRSRLALTGPLMGYAAAQSAAVQNLKDKDFRLQNTDTEEGLLVRAKEFQSCGGYYEGIVPEPYTGAWEEYGNILQAIATAPINNEQSGMVVSCANMDAFLRFDSWHMLLDPWFYRAVASENYCYFKDGDERDWLETYDNYTSWGLPKLNSFFQTLNSEYFGLGLWQYNHELGSVIHGWNDAITNYYEIEGMDPLHEIAYEYIENDIDANRHVDVSNLGYVYYGFDSFSASEFQWHFYNRGYWLRDSYRETLEDFPFESGKQMKQEYNYRGANSAVDCYVNTDNVSANLMKIDADYIHWEAAAKPFGYLEDPDGSGENRAPIFFGLVIPAFHDVRLIHNELSTRWRVEEPGFETHVYVHLVDYADQGPDAIKDNGCWYCRQLEKWELPETRARIRSKLEANQSAIDSGEACVDSFTPMGSG